MQEILEEVSAEQLHLKLAKALVLVLVVALQYLLDLESYRQVREVLLFKLHLRLHLATPELFQLQRELHLNQQQVLLN